MNNKDLQDLELLLDRKLSGIASDVAALKENVSGLEGRFDSLEGRFDNLEGRLDGHDRRLDRLEQEMKVIRVDLLENNVIPRLNTIEKCYLDTAKRYTESADRFDSAITDIEVMKLAIQKNSADIQELKRKQA